MVGLPTNGRYTDLGGSPEAAAQAAAQTLQAGGGLMEAAHKTSWNEVQE